MKFEDGLTIDNLIDSVGCPSLDDLPEFYGFQTKVEGAANNCRGDHVPTSPSQPALANVECPSAALMRNGEIKSDWKLSLECNEGQTQWRMSPSSNIGSNTVLNDPESSDPMFSQMRQRIVGEEFDIRKFQWPYCIGGGDGGGGRMSSGSVKLPSNILTLFLSLVVFLISRKMTSLTPVSRSRYLLI